MSDESWEMKEMADEEALMRRQSTPVRISSFKSPGEIAVTALIDLPIFYFGWKLLDYLWAMKG